MEKGHISKELAKFCMNTKYEDIPAPILRKMKVHILDTLGAGIAGALSDESTKLDKALSAAGESGGNVAIWGTGRKACPRNAALANGLSCHAFELDDTGGCDHSGAVVIPAALAALPLAGRKISGKEFVTTIIVGYDIARRALESCGAYEPHNEAGWHSTGTCGTFGAAVAAGLVLGLNEEQMGWALGLAASTSAGLWAFIHDGAQSKKLHPGRAAEGGLMGALLAKEGFRGPRMIFDDVWGGFTKTFAPQSSDYGAWLRDLGSNWKLARVSIKPHASCRSTHAGIDAVDTILRDHEITLENVAKIHVRLNPFVNGMCGGCNRSTLANTQMSLPYGIAARLLYGAASLSSYSDERRNSTQIENILNKIVLDVDNSMKADDEPYVTVITSKGETYGLCVEMPLGSPTNPWPEESVIGKYRSLASMVWKGSTTNILADKVMNMESVDDMSEINKILSTEPDIKTIFR